MERIDNYIDGSLRGSLSGGLLANVEPATGAVYSQIADSDGDDVIQAVAAAKRAFPRWSALPAAERSRWIMRLADRVEANLEALARAESIDTGKPIAMARNVEIPRVISSLRFFATAILHTSSEVHAMDSGALNYTLRGPRGVAGVISPWNLPLYLLTWKIAPALATGNTVVAKPTELAPMTAFLFSKLCIEVELPPGVLNVVHGTGAKAGAALVRHPDVPTISFTGGTATGSDIARTGGPLFKKISLELGGKNPNIVFADCDRETTVRESVRAAFTNQGQVCLCGSRILCERSYFDEFVEDFTRQVRQLKIGDPLELETQQGSLISRAHREKVRGYIHLAQEEGGRLLCGGVDAPEVPTRCRDGYFVSPTVVVGLPADCRVNQEEIFGPVVTIMHFDRESEAVTLANGTAFGLAASVWTRDVARAHRLAQGIQSGTVWINCWMVRDLRVPFGGMKSSGVGREGGEEALRFYTEPKNVCLRIPAVEDDRS